MRDTSQHPAKMVSSVAGRTIVNQHARQPIVPVTGNGLNSNFQPKVPAPAVRNPLQRQPPNY